MLTELERQEVINAAIATDLIEEPDEPSGGQDLSGLVSATGTEADAYADTETGSYSLISLAKGILRRIIEAIAILQPELSSAGGSVNSVGDNIAIDLSSIPGATGTSSLVLYSLVVQNAAADSPVSVIVKAGVDIVYTVVCVDQGDGIAGPIAGGKGLELPSDADLVINLSDPVLVNWSAVYGVNL